MRAARFFKRLQVILICTLALLCCAVATARADSADLTGSYGDALVVGVPVDRCPVFYLDAETDEVTGIGADLMRSAAQEVGYVVTFTPLAEQTLKDALDNDAYDVILPFGSAITSTSGKQSIVSDNLIQTPFTLVTKNNRVLPDLNELHVGMLSSLRGGAETVSELYPGIHITFYESMAECVDALRAGSVDALLHNSYVWSYVLQKPSYADLAVQPAAMFSMDFRAGTLDTPEGEARIARLNNGIATLSDTRRQAIVLDHTTRRLYQYDLYDYLFQYRFVLQLGLTLLASLAAFVAHRRRAYRLEQEERVRRLIDHDALTGAFSHNGFKKRVEELLRANPDTPYLLVYSNIKDFKYVNDGLGREAGDDLLRFWVATTQESLSDQEAIGRLEGDHFGVLRLNKGAEQVRWDDKEIIGRVRNYYIDRGDEYRVHVCGGIYVLTPEDYEQPNVDRMLDYARVAEKRVQSSRDDGFAFYNPEQWNKGKRIAEIVAHLPVALESGEVQVWYQPQVDYRTGRITSAEALCRWNHTKLGRLSPEEFIPALEEHGLVYKLDHFVWERVCQDVQRWNQQGVRRSVSVNLSRHDILENPDVPEVFCDLVRTYDLSADQLHVEITESAYVESPELLIRTTARLRELGFKVEMDDFGSGYSSLNMLKEVPLDRIKLDLRFLSEAGDQERGRIIVSHVVHMVEALGTDLIAEGVETKTQAQFLSEQGCNSMQGYYFYKPMQVHDFEQVAGA